MVGVPGKYKGCETCRRRRVKCTNERPYCQKCITSGRQCEGYERERVFITGTPETKGRVASHPKKGTPPKKQKASFGGDSRLELVPLHPLTSAWDDCISLYSHGGQFKAMVTALQTKLGNVSREELEDDSGFSVSLPPYFPHEVQPSRGEDDFETRAMCLAHLSSSDDGEDDVRSFFVYLFEQNFATPSSMDAAPWGIAAEKMSFVRSMGADHFMAFPNHHFFIRVFRPMAVSLALLSRQDTFLSEHEWITRPWEQHPKSPLDELFDTMLFLPSIFARTDQIVPLQATLDRRLKAQGLLHSCLALEAQFDQWLHHPSMSHGQNGPAYWAEELVSPGAEIPFANAFTFRDAQAGMMFLYYWMSQIQFHRCIDTLNRTIFQPVIDSYPDMWPDLPPSLQIDPTRYQHGRELAANICRGLDSALEHTVQPDILLAPMTAALDLYREINATSQDGVLEIMWLEAFKGRLMGKGQHVANVLQGQKWTEVANF